MLSHKVKLPKWVGLRLGSQRLRRVCVCVKLRSLNEEEVVWSLEGPSTPCSEGLHHQGVQQQQRLY